MPYPRRLLNDGEEIALDIHPHWWFMSRPAAAFLVSGVLFLWLLAVLDGAAWETGLKWIVGLVALASLVWLAIRWLVWRTTHFVITSDRVIARKGVVAKSGIEIPLERVNNVSFKQSLFERLIDAGDLATFPGTTVIALPLGMLAGYLFSGFLRVATPWRILISGITGLYWALPFTGFFPLATSITTVTEFFSGKPAEDGPRP